MCNLADCNSWKEIVRLSISYLIVIAVIVLGFYMLKGE